MTPTIKIEAALTALIAGWTGRTIDVDIVRGALPERVTETVAVRIVGETKSRYQYLRNLSSRVIGKFKSRDDARRLIDQVLAQLPAGNTIVGGVEITYIEMDAANEPFAVESDGQVLWMVSLNIQFSCRD